MLQLKSTSGMRARCCSVAVEGAKTVETRQRRIEKAGNALKEGRTR
ncbi:YdeI/OmpD-associated family protein [Paenibacillus allorhizosphaerae]|nr:YdeI/OmpD-associated family protein [Paenibacillus allorhizosphaerae]